MVQLDKMALIRALRRADVPANNDVLTWSNDQLVWAAAPGAAGGEANTASNQGVGGVGVFKQKTLVDLEFKNINAGSSKVTITDDSGNNEIDVDVDPEAIMPLTTKGDIMAFGTAHSRLPVGTNDQVLTADSAQSLGVKWADASGSGSGLTVLENTSTDQSTTSTSTVDVTGFTFAVSANTNYIFEAHLGVVTAGSTSGVGFAINGPAATAVYVQALMEHSATAKFSGQTRTLDGAITSTNGSATEFPCKVWAIIRVGANSGTAALRFRSEVGGSTTIKQNSYGWYAQV